MTHPYGPRQRPHWQPPPGWSPDLPLPPSPPPIRRPSSPKPPISGTANAALLVAVLSTPALFFALFWPAAVAAATVGSPAYVIATVAGLVLTPQILGYLTLREIRQGRADPISRQRAVLAMGISGVYLLLALGIFLSSLGGG